MRIHIIKVHFSAIDACAFAPPYVKLNCRKILKLIYLFISIFFGLGYCTFMKSPAFYFFIDYTIYILYYTLLYYTSVLLCTTYYTYLYTILYYYNTLLYYLYVILLHICLLIALVISL